LWAIAHIKIKRTSDVISGNLNPPISSSDEDNILCLEVLHFVFIRISWRRETGIMSDDVNPHQAEEDARNADILIYVNGEMRPRNEAMVSVYDSGFMLGDGVWEGMRLYKGK